METTTLLRSTQKVRRDALGGKRPDGPTRLLDPRHRLDPHTIHAEATDPSFMTNVVTWWSGEVADTYRGRAFPGRGKTLQPTDVALVSATVCTLDRE